MPVSQPFVLPKLEITPNVGSTPTKIFGSQHACFIDSVSLCNTTDGDIFFDIKIIGEREENNILVLKEAFHSRKRLLKANETIELELGSIKSPESGDLLFANSDFSGNNFDVLVSYRELNEVPLNV